MIGTIVCLILVAPPSLHPVPPAVAPYVHLLQREPLVVDWLIRHRQSPAPLSEMIADPGLPPTLRQRIWQFKQKVDDRKEAP